MDQSPKSKIQSPTQINQKSIDLRKKAKKIKDQAAVHPRKKGRAAKRSAGQNRAWQSRSQQGRAGQSKGEQAKHGDGGSSSSPNAGGGQPNSQVNDEEIHIFVKTVSCKTISILADLSIVTSLQIPNIINWLSYVLRVIFSQENLM